MALEPAKLSDFKLAGALGSGATARVYEATQIATGRPVAIKMMEDSGSSPEMRERFAREALLLSGVQSRHVSKIVGFGFEKGQPFLVLEKLTGETLDAKLRRDGPPTPQVAVKWIEQLIIGIRDCHDAKIIHRDIKPSNIFLHRENGAELVKVIDFGVARLRELTDDGSGALTSANHLIGSMGYMAPEQFTNAKGVQFTADLYAIGVVVFRTLTGRLPFVSRSLHAVIKMKSEQSVPVISSMPNMPNNAVLDWFVQKSTAREPTARFKNAREMLDHWWNVMSSLEDNGATQVSRNMHANIIFHPSPEIPESSSAPSTQPETAVPSTPKVNTPQYDSLEDRTLHRPNRFNDIPKRPTDPPATALPVSSGTELTLQRAFPGIPSLVEDEVPRTVRQPDETAAFADDSDPFDMPTKSDPNLRKLVERELALQKARKERGK
jgi:serine/threonine protein kinase